jgi:hypothetical protein
MTYVERLRSAQEILMTEEQAVQLWRLCEEAGTPRSYDSTLTQQRAAGRIEALLDEIRSRLLPPHTD